MASLLLQCPSQAQSAVSQSQSPISHQTSSPSQLSVASHLRPLKVLFDIVIQAFLVVLFLVQSRGTAMLSYVFSPVTCVWLLLLASTGIVNIVSYPGIFRAFDPSRAVLRTYPLSRFYVYMLISYHSVRANQELRSSCWYPPGSHRMRSLVRKVRPTLL